MRKGEREGVRYRETKTRILFLRCKISLYTFALRNEKNTIREGERVKVGERMAEK
jgi:hypothetical protein